MTEMCIKKFIVHIIDCVMKINSQHIFALEKNELSKSFKKSKPFRVHVYQIKLLYIKLMNLIVKGDNNF